MYDVFVSFDYENDRRYKFMLEAWNSNPRFNFQFEDRSSREIQSNNIGRIKAALTSKIASANRTLVIVGAYANSMHPDASKIGELNWQNWEIRKSYELGIPLVGVKIDKNYKSPERLLNVNTTWAYSFTEQGILSALESVGPVS